MNQKIGPNEEKIIEESVADYLYGKRDQAFINLSHKLQERDVEEIKAILKQKLFSYMKANGGRVGNIEHSGSLYKLIDRFNAQEFIKRKWKYVPYYVPADSYERMKTSFKYPIRLKRYKYDKPLYEFANDVEFADRKARYQESHSQAKTDIRFYVDHDFKSQNKGMMFAKVVNLKYKPSLLRVVNEEEKKHANAQDALIADKFLYDRSLSISMYVLMDGDPNAAMPIARYDNDMYPHHNVFIGDDKRKTIFGDTAASPHFHFQNEEDSLLCLRRSRADGKYRTGRCNAIDCYHLKQYLKKLDRLNKSEIQRNVREKNDYGMPFLNMKAKNIAVFKDPEPMIRKYFENNRVNNSVVLKWFDKTREYDLYKSAPNRIFTNLIKSLDLLDFIANSQKVCLDAKESKMMSDVEVLLANNVVSNMNLIKEYDNLITQQLNDDYYGIDHENENN